MGKKVIHFEIIGTDGKKLQSFYSKLFDWKVDANNTMNYGMVDAAEAGIGVGISAGQPGQPARVTAYVEVENLDEYLKKAERLGDKTILEPTDVPAGPRLAMIADPEGHIMGLIQAGSMR